MHQNCRGWVSAPDHARGAYNDPDIHAACGWERKKTGIKFVSLAELLGLPGCVPDLTGNYIISFAIIRNFLFLNNQQF